MYIFYFSFYTYRPMAKFFGGQNVDDLFWKCVKKNPSSNKPAPTPHHFIKKITNPH
jgi:hypothetical protein